MKKSPEDAALNGELLGEPYTPPNRSGVFDVPSYDDIADMQVLFKRFANTTIANGGDIFTGNYNLNGSLFINGKAITPQDILVVINETTSFTVTLTQALSSARFMVFSDVDVVATMLNDVSGVPDGTRISIVQTGKGKVNIAGPKAIGTLKTSGKFTTLECMFHDGFWWCLSAGGGGGGAEGTPAKPVTAFNTLFTAITWLPVAGTAGPTLGYGYSVDPTEGIVCSLSGTTLTISSVIEGPDYAFNVWGINSAGRGESSIEISHTWSGLLAPVIAAASAPAGITISWTAVPGATSYLGQYKKKADINWTNVVVPVGTSFIIGNLFTSEIYQVRLACNKNNVTSPYSNIAEATPGPGIPDDIVLTRGAGTGQWQITNFKSTNIYKITCTAGAGSVNSTGVLTLDNPNTVGTLTVQLAVGAPIKTTYMQRRGYTYHQENRPDCNAVCRFAGWNCFACPNCVGCQ